MPSLHRINISAPSRSKIQEAKRKAKNRKKSLAKVFWDHLDSLPIEPPRNTGISYDPLP